MYCQKSSDVRNWIGKYRLAGFLDLFAIHGKHSIRMQMVIPYLITNVLTLPEWISDSLWVSCVIYRLVLCGTLLQGCVRVNFTGRKYEILLCK